MIVPDYPETSPDEKDDRKDMTDNHYLPALPNDEHTEEEKHYIQVDGFQGVLGRYLKSGEHYKRAY